MSEQPIDPLIQEPPPRPPSSAAAQESLASPAAVDPLNPISCESCRHRKIKCSRILPVCQECIKNGESCTWPERAKRGPPAGYIEGLEVRLAQTEAALFNALAALGVGASTEFRSTGEIYDRFARYSSAQSRADRMASWVVAPLDNPDAQQEWWRQCHEKIALPEELPARPRLRRLQTADSPGVRTGRPRKGPATPTSQSYYAPDTDDSVMQAVAQVASYRAPLDNPTTPLTARPASYDVSATSQNSGAGAGSPDPPSYAGTKRRIEDFLDEQEPSQDRRYF